MVDPESFKSFPKPFQPFLSAHLNSMWQPSTLRTTIRGTARDHTKLKAIFIVLSVLHYISPDLFLVLLQSPRSPCSQSTFIPLRLWLLVWTLGPSSLPAYLTFSIFFLAPFHCFVTPADSQEQSLLGTPQLSNLAKNQSRQQKKKTEHPPNKDRYLH